MHASPSPGGPAPGPGVVLLLSGAGGVGKGSLVARLLQLRPGVWVSRSWTTRPRRAGEREDAYVWVSRQQFLERVAAGGFLEWTEFPGNGHLYGTPTFEDGEGRDVVLEIELDGARQVKARLPDAVHVMVVAPSPADLEARMLRRGDDPGSVARRLAYAVEEERLGRLVADHVVVNDDLQRAAAELAAILDRHRSGR